jgi:hypothetical protein
MAEYLSMDDPTFWARCPKELQPLIQNNLKASYFLMGDRKDNPPTVIALHLGPGWVLARHAHSGHRFEVIVQGSLDVGEKILKAGDIMMSEPGVPYGPHVAGSEGCTTFEIFTNYRDSYVTLLEGPNGVEECDLTTADGMKRMQDLLAREVQPA